jgi:hypothetical protein
MKNVGIQLNKDYDVDIKIRRDAQGKIAGGMVVGEVTHQNQAIILFAQKGEIKEYPTIGVGLGNACNDEGFALWKREIAEQIEADGQRIETLIFNEQEFYLKANY